MKDIGNLGESCFAKWCDQVGITSNLPKIDRHGWDFYLEFPSEDHQNISLDMQPAPLECKVQVKSTDKRRKGEQIELSNLFRLIKTPLPAFFCFIEFDGEIEPVSAYLVHIDEIIIEHTLKGLKKADIANERNKINKKKITINFNNSHKLDPLNGISLKKAILSHVKNGLEEYINHKYNLVKSLGFEDGSVDITFETDNVNSLNDVFLGIKPEAIIKNLRLSRTKGDNKNLS